MSTLLQILAIAGALIIVALVVGYFSERQEKKTKK
jgi:FtsZ-interacting cell division protein ZipA